MNYNALVYKLPAATLVATLALTGCSKENTSSPEPLPAQPGATAFNAAESAGAILFAANTAPGGPHDIYHKDLQTGKVTNLTNTPHADELNPQISPDKQQAVYAGNSSGNYQIFRINLASKEITRLTTHDANDFDPTYTPTGDILYKSNASDGYGDIWKMTGAGKEQHNLTATMDQTEEWKPTAVGDHLVVFTGRHADDGSLTREQLATTDELMLLDTRTPNAQPRRLTNNNWPDWYSEADPTRPGVIAFTSKETPGGADTIYEMNVMQTEPAKQRHRLTDPAVLPGDSSDCSWAPDGTLLFVNNGSGDGRYNALARTPSGTLYMIESGASGEVLSPVAIGSIALG